MDTKTITLDASERITVDLAITLAIRYMKELDERTKALGLNIPSVCDPETISDMEALHDKVRVDV